MSGRTVYILLLLACMTVSSPIESDADQLKQTEQAENATVFQSKDKLRQDGEGGEDGGDLGAQVGNLLEGVVTGDFNTILGGAASFIPDDGTQQGINTIFEAVAPFLNTGLATALNRTKQYVGVTDPSAVKATTKAPAASPQYIQVAGPGGVPVLIQIPGAAGQPATAQQAGTAAVTAAPTTTAATTEDDDEDEDNAKL